jgi:hypothetical protein
MLLSQSVVYTLSGSVSYRYETNELAPPSPRSLRDSTGRVRSGSSVDSCPPEPVGATKGPRLGIRLGACKAIAGEVGHHQLGPVGPALILVRILIALTSLRVLEREVGGHHSGPVGPALMWVFTRMVWLLSGIKVVAFHQSGPVGPALTCVFTCMVLAPFKANKVSGPPAAALYLVNAHFAWKADTAERKILGR